MAATIRANPIPSWKAAARPRAGLSQFNTPKSIINHPSVSVSRIKIKIPSSSTYSNSNLCRRRRVLRMAQATAAADLQNNNNSSSSNISEIKEPSPKIPKLHENGVHEVSQYPPTSVLFRVKRLSEKAVLPSRASPLSAGYDLSSAAEAKVPARGKALIPTDLSIAIPRGTYARIAPRSGLAWKHSIDVGAGVIDADYRGPVGVILFNHSDVDFEVKAGHRVAQLIIEKIVTPDVIEVQDLDATVRGDDGFGSTGV